MTIYEQHFGGCWNKRRSTRAETNEQVAEQLVISPRTVNTHITAIYGKIGVSSRSAATRYAMEHHLV